MHVPRLGNEGNTGKLWYGKMTTPPYLSGYPYLNDLHGTDEDTKEWNKVKLLQYAK